MALVVQRIGARTLPKIFEVDDAVLKTFLPLLSGQVEVFTLKASGGKAISVTPSPLNRVRISVRSRASDGAIISCSFTVPHIKETVDYQTLVNLIKGKFDAYWIDKAPKADDVAIIYDKINVK
jgi:hypothetical protein